MVQLNALCGNRKAIALTIIVMLLTFILFGSHSFTSSPITAELQSTTDHTSLVHEVTCKPCPDCPPSTTSSSYRGVEDPDDDKDSICGNGSMKRFPQAVIIGVKKGGTRALIDMLKSHPSIVAARGEVHYFDREEYFENGVQWYIDRMPCTTKQQVTIEKSPGYFVSKETPLRMKMVSRNVKPILIVRNPIDRLLSDFAQLDAKQEKKNKTTRNVFEDLVFLENGEVNTAYTPISVSVYEVFFANWLQHFTLDQLHVVDGDELIKSPATALQKIEHYLQLPPYFTSDRFYFNESKGFYCWKKEDRKGIEVPYCLGEGKGREHLILSPSDLEKLKKFYAPHNQKFYELTGQNFGW